MLGALTYLRRTIPGFAKIAEPLHELLRGKQQKLAWNDDAQLAFEKLKASVTSEPCLAFPNLAEKFILFCDGSSKAIGAMLAQKQESKLRPIGYFSRMLSRSERLWSIAEIESLSIVEGLLHWQSLLRYSEVLIFSDNRAARFILTADRQPSERRAKLVANFSGASIQHIEGSVMLWQISYLAQNVKVAVLIALIVNETVRKVRISRRSKKNTEPLPADPKLKDRFVWDLIDEVRNKNCKRVEGAVMANHTSSGASSDDGEGSKRDNYPEPQIDSVMHKDLLDAVLHDLKTQERIEDLQKKCSYTGPMLHLLTHGRFDNMGSPLPYKLRVLYEKEAKNFQVINRMMFTKDVSGTVEPVIYTGTISSEFGVP